MKVCFLQVHYTDQNFLLDPATNCIARLKESNIFDEIVLAAANVPENACIHQYAEQYGIRAFLGDVSNIARRMQGVADNFDATVLARILVNYIHTDLTLVANMLDFALQKNLDYVNVPFDFDIKYGCDVITRQGVDKLCAVLASDPALTEAYQFRPWYLLESSHQFVTETYEDVPEYSNEMFYRYRYELLTVAPVAWEYGEGFYPQSYHFMRQLLEPGDTVLDISCGYGTGSACLAPFCETIYGFDVADELLEKARQRYSKKHPNAHFVLGREGAIPFEPASMDKIVSIHTMEHVANDDLFLQHLAVILKPGGRLLLEVPLRVRRPFSGNNEPLLPHTDSFAGHYREYSADAFADQVGRCFEVLEFRGVNRGEYVPMKHARNAIMAILTK